MTEREFKMTKVNNIGEPVPSLGMFIALQVDIAALGHCLERPDFREDIAPGAQMTDDDYRAGIRKVFADEDGFEEWMVEQLLHSFKEEKQIEAVAQNIATALVGNMFSGGW